MNRWLRVVFPLWPWAAAILMIVQACVSAYCWWWFRDPWRRPEEIELVVVQLGLALVLYGQYRVLGFHPLWRREYFAWLRETPWHRGQPLPLGPVHLVAQDVVVVGVATIAGWWYSGGVRINFVLLPIAFVVSYLLTLMVTLRISDNWGFAYAVGAGFGATIWLRPDLIGMAISLAVTCAIAMVGLHRSWLTFPWPVEKLHRSLGQIQQASKGEAVVDDAALGWPFQALSPQPGRAVFVPWHDAGLLGMVAGWWLYAICSHITFAAVQCGVFVLSLMALVGPLSLWRLTEYFLGVASPISFWGRLWTGRWLILRFDIAWFPLAVTAFNAWVGIKTLLETAPLRARWPGWDPAAFAGVWLAYMILVLLIRRPYLRKWRLTGAMRLQPTLAQRGVGQQKSQYVQCN